MGGDGRRERLRALRAHPNPVRAAAKLVGVVIYVVSEISRQAVRPPWDLHPGGPIFRRQAALLSDFRQKKMEFDAAITYNEIRL